jgi:hypothetical protein
MLRLLQNRTDYSPFLQLRETTQKFTERDYLRRPLTTDQLCSVHLATIREGVNHCRWPKEVIERFLAVVV